MQVSPKSVLSSELASIDAEKPDIVSNLQNKQFNSTDEKLKRYHTTQNIVQDSANSSIGTFSLGYLLEPGFITDFPDKLN